MAGTPIKFYRSAEELRYLPPASGQHTRELLDQFGFSSQEVELLLNDDTVLEQCRS